MRKLLSFAACLSLLAMSVGCNAVGENKPSSDTAHYGIDISHYQGGLIHELDSSSKLRFIISKATQGDTYLDADFHANWQQTKQRGFVRGAYHFYMADDDAIDQVKNFFAAVGELDSRDMPPIVDIEKMSLADGFVKDAGYKALQDDFLTFLITLEQKLKRKPMIYTDYHFAQEYLLDPKFAEYDLWLAEYSGSKQPKVPDTWKEKGYKIWQKSDTHVADKGLVETDFDEYVGAMKNLVK